MHSIRLFVVCNRKRVSQSSNLNFSSSILLQSYRCIIANTIDILQCNYFLTNRVQKGKGYFMLNLTWRWGKRFRYVRCQDECFSYNGNDAKERQQEKKIITVVFFHLHCNALQRQLNRHTHTHTYSHSYIQIK